MSLWVCTRCHLFVFVIHTNMFIVIMKNVLLSTTDHCNSYILLCEVIAITTVTLIELKCCYDISLVHGNKQHCYCDNTVYYYETIYFVTITKFNDVIVTFCELSYPMHQCDNKFLLLWQIIFYSVVCSKWMISSSEHNNVSRLSGPSTLSVINCCVSESDNTVELY